MRNRTSLRDVVYGRAGGVDLTLDLHYPKIRVSGPLPLVVAVHGGGWSEGDKAGFDLPQARGHLVASVNYRLHPAFRFPAMIEDVKLAIRYLRANATGYNIDPARIAILGHSAGAHLAALAALCGPQAGWDTGEHLDTSSEVAAAVILSGPTDLTRRFGDPWAEELRHTVFGETQWITGSPALRVRPDAPPFLIVHGADDPVVEVAHARVLHDALLAAGVASELFIVRRAGHGFEPVGGSRLFASPRALLTMARLHRRVMTFVNQATR